MLAEYGYLFKRCCFKTGHGAMQPGGFIDYEKLAGVMGMYPG